MKNPKACEKCRQRKVRCSGEQPCQHCQANPSECTYREKPRPKRLSKAHARSTVASDEASAASSSTSASLSRIATRDEQVVQPLAGQLETHEAQQPEVHDSVAATHHAPQSTDSTQLYYGPSSNFAFLQQIHRGILYNGSHGQKRGGHEMREWGPGLDMFMQRKIFFGTPLKVAIERNQPLTFQACTASFAQATIYLEHFKASAIHTLPFFTPSELDNLLPSMYSDSIVIQPQIKALLLAVLAIGALCTTHTETAETLFLSAKQEAVVYDEAVTLPMVQFSLLITDYQLNMGRPNSAHLHLGVACRKAFALGLHTGTGFSPFRDEERQAHRITLCCLYYYEIWVGLVVGRKSMITRADISCPYPDGQPTLVSLCTMVTKLEEGTVAIYSQRSESFRQLYSVAEKTHIALRQVAQQLGISSPSPTLGNGIMNELPLMLLQTTYYYAIMLTFRPFLIAESALQSSRIGNQPGEMWLKQACRHAIDAAQDCINVIFNMFQKSDACKVKRYTAFFLESSCSVLLHDSLQHPFKHPHNMEYIKMAIDCLRAMVDDDPVTNATNSIQRVLQAVEQSISNGSHASPQGSLTATSSPHPSFNSLSNDINQHVYPNIQFPSLDRNSSAATDDLIHFSDRNYQAAAQPIAGYQVPLPASNAQSGIPALNPFSTLNFDVLTTDLFNFFPVGMPPLDP